MNYPQAIVISAAIVAGTLLVSKTALTQDQQRTAIQMMSGVPGLATANPMNVWVLDDEGRIRLCWAKQIPDETPSCTRATNL